MINSIISKYEGICLYDERGSYTYSDLKNQIEKFRTILNKEILKNQNIVIVQSTILLKQNKIYL